MRVQIPSRKWRFGDIDLSQPAAAALAAVAPTLTIQTNLTPPVTIDLTGGGGGSGQGLMTLLQPTLTLNTVAGPVQIAPAGASGGISPNLTTWSVFAGLLLAGFVGLGYYLGVSSK